MRFATVMLLALGCTNGKGTDPVECTDDHGEPVLVYVDEDGDGFGGAAVYVPMDEWESNFVEESGDCNDLDAAINPDADELCDGLDNNCNGTVDDGAGVDWYLDEDGDGFGVGDPQRSCEPIAGTSEQSGDCDDTDENKAPDFEICDGLDNDCDDTTAIDEGATDCPADASWHTFENSVYLVFDGNYVHGDLSTTCGDVGYRPVHIESAAEEAAVVGWLDSLSTGGAWTGAIVGGSCPSGAWSWFDPRDQSCIPFSGYADGLGLPTLNLFSLVLESGGALAVRDSTGATPYGVVCEVPF